MFVLIQVSDTIHIPPVQFDESLNDCVHDHINIHYVNKVLPNEGLVIGIYGIESYNSPTVHPIDGGAHIHVKFHLIVFRPFLGEILVGTIKSIDSTGILISLTNFFHHLYLPAGELQSNSYYDNTENVWIWNYEGNQLYMDLESEIRVKVINLQYGKQIINNDYDAIYGNGENMNVYEMEEKLKIEEENKGVNIQQTNTNNSTNISTTVSKDNATTSNTTSTNTATTSSISSTTTTTTTTNPNITTTNTTSSPPAPVIPIKKRETISSFVSPMRVVVSVAEDGLGLTSWWT
jgi:DNA-directed RNA polymerase III subunit RPC8